MECEFLNDPAKKERTDGNARLIPWTCERKKEARKETRRIRKSLSFSPHIAKHESEVKERKEETRELLTHAALLIGVHPSVRRVLPASLPPTTLSPPSPIISITTEHKALHRGFLRIQSSRLAESRNSVAEGIARSRVARFTNSII